MLTENYNTYMNKKVTIITVGDEILIGQIVDTNSAWIGKQLNGIGLEVHEILSISDTEQGILGAVNRATKTSDVVLMTGGLGPTKDDITKKTLADFYGDEMVFDQAVYDHILALFKRFGKEPSSAHHAQSYMPSGIQVLFNKMGTAPGMLWEKKDHILVSMPGVPLEMKHLMETHVLPLLKERYEDGAIEHYTIRTAGEGESRMADRIQKYIDEFPPHVSVAYLPSLGNVRIRLTGRGSDAVAIKSELKKLAQPIIRELGDLVYGYDDDDLITVIGQLCKEKGLSIGTAESCTGGRVAQTIVNKSGSSAFFQGSTVTYSNELKMKLLKVEEASLRDHGAVSEQVVHEMVAGGLELLDVDVVVSISGIAGPTGGSEEKPVGTIWMACGNKDRIETKLINATKNREKNIEYATNYALDLVRRFLQSV